MAERPECSLPDCVRPVRSRGFCKPHYQSWYVYGDPLKARIGQPNRTPPSDSNGGRVRWGDPVARFWASVEKTDDCWLWTAAINHGGYGSRYFNGRQQLAHRISYELTHGEIPEGLHIDHLCRVRRCVRPSHLEAVTQAENNLRAESASGIYFTTESARAAAMRRWHPDSKGTGDG